MLHRYSQSLALSWLLACTTPSFALEDRAETQKESILDYNTAAQLTLDKALPLKAAELEISIKEAQEYQAKLWHNPILSVGVDGFGCGNNQGWNNSGVSVGLSQTFELGHKHCREREVAAVETYAAIWDYEAGRQDIMLQLMDAFIDAAAAQEKKKLTEQRQKLSDQSLECTKQKVESGKASAIEQKKSELDCCCGKIAAMKARKDFDIAKRKMALLWGCQQPDFNEVSFPFYKVQPLPELSEFNCFLEQTPEWSKGQLSVYAAATATALENANRYPDLEVSAGVSTDEGFGDPGFFVEFSFPLQIFDRNQGNIRRACLQELQTEYLLENLICELKSRLESTYLELQAARENAQAMLQFATTAVEDTVKSTQEGYNEGKYQLTDLIDAQKSALDVKDQLIDALTEYHHKNAEIMRLTGQIAKD